MEVDETGTKLYVPNKENPKVIAGHPFFSRTNYQNLRNQITDAGLTQPVMKDLALVVDDAWENPEGKHEKEVLDIIWSRYFRAFQGLDYIPNEGVYIVNRPDFGDNGVILDRDELVKRLEKNDPGVTHVKSGYKTGEMSPSELAKNHFVIGLAGGEEGADALGRVADRYKQKTRKDPFLYALSDVDSEEKRVGALGACWYRNRLNVCGDSDGSGVVARAFGTFPLDK